MKEAYHFQPNRKVEEAYHSRPNRGAAGSEWGNTQSWRKKLESTLSVVNGIVVMLAVGHSNESGILKC